MEELSINKAKLNDETGLTHECGVFGAIGSENWENNTEIAQIILIGLQALQHRGQESTGMVTNEGTNNEFNVHKGMGLVKNVFTNESISQLKGIMGIGHTRYSTSAKSTAINAQPFVVHSMHGSLAVAHNGELVNAAALRKQVLDRGVGLSTHSDSELITQALCLIPPDGEINGPDWPARIRHLMQLAPLSYSLVIMLKDRIYAVRDPYGNRPLCLGKIIASSQEIINGFSDDLVTKIIENEKAADGWVVASESCAFMKITRYLHEVQPGEIVELTRSGPKTIDIIPTPEGRNLAFCIFEYVYFARPTSIFEGQEVYNVRVHCGRQLALEHPVEADIVGSVPESGNAAAHGYSLESKIPQGELLAKNSYVGRTFIQPTNRLRQMNVALKFSPILTNVKGKRIILIDDSIVRGNTVGPIIKLLRKSGAKEVHIRIASPPLKYPCYMGINIPTREELIANAKDFEDIALKVGADSLHYLSVEGLIKAVQKDLKTAKIGHCTACLTGDYPGGLPDKLECAGTMLSVPAPTAASVSPLSDPVIHSAAAASVTQTNFTTDTDQGQFEADKRAVYKHPLFPLLALLFERCELATQSSEPQSSDAFNLDIQAFVQHQERDRKPFLADEPEIDGLMIKSIQVLRIHLLELEKVQELCKDFCNRYITCLKGKMQSENLLRSDYPQDILGNSLMGGIESNNNNNNSMMSHGNSESGSASNSPVQYSSMGSHTGLLAQQLPTLDRSSATTPSVENSSYSLSHYGNNGPTPPLQVSGISAQPSPVPQVVAESLVVHGSTPLSQIGAHLCQSNAAAPQSDSSGPLSPAPTTPGGSNDDCDSDFSRGGKKQKRGILPKHATSVMRSWLFQHLVHPYPTEDEKRQIAAQTNLTLLQVNNWFINARRRILQPMLDASTPAGQDSSGQSNSPGNGGINSKKKKIQNNNRRFWPQEFGNIQPNLESGMLSSSDDEGDSFSSDDEGGGLIIDTPQNNGINENGHQNNESNNLPSVVFGNGDSENTRQ